MNTATYPEMLQKTLSSSRYVKRTLDSDPVLLDWLQQNYNTPCGRSEMQEWLRQSLSPALPREGGGRNGVAHATINSYDEAELAKVLRTLRKRVMVKLILRDVNGLADLDEVMQAMTALAELCVQNAQSCLMNAMVTQFGNPIG